jgi:methylated-DNA-protein-cysteine methyltransferase related protein
LVDISSFNRQVYETVLRIPRGMVTTYGAIAACLGDPRKAREVGWALHAKPEGEEAPAHRVVNRDGKTPGDWAFGGGGAQRALLEAEGVSFLTDGRVDMEHHLWLPDEVTGEDDGDQARLF